MRDRTKLSERQQNILAFIDSYQAKHGFPPTIREIGNATGIASTSVVNYNLAKLVSLGHLERSARASRGLRLVKPATSGKAPAPVRTRVTDRFLRVPLVGQIVASEPVPIPEEMGSYYDEDSMVELPPSMLGGVDPSQVFALRVKGDSMIDAMIRNGDIVIFHKQEVANNGDMVAVWLAERGETTLKYFYREGKRVRLQPAHPTMEPIYVEAAQCQIQGRVLSVIRPSV